MGTRSNDVTTTADERGGVVEWFPMGDRRRVEDTLEVMRELGLHRLRTGVSWADWCSDGGREWFAWLLPRLADEPRLDVLPCLRSVPSALGVVREPPVSPPKAYAEFVDALLGTYGDAFDYVELWSEPNDVAEWDFALDPARRALAETI